MKNAPYAEAYRPAFWHRDSTTAVEEPGQRPRTVARAANRRILVPGRNAWRIARSTRSAVLIDGDNYFRRLEQAMRKARRSIWIIGWDFNGDISLHPDRRKEPQTLGELLRKLVEKHPELEIRILVWALGPIYSARSFRPFRKAGWADHPRIHIRFDFKLPLRGSHHQKVVVIDDTIAFAGGIDLTTNRWDTCDHVAELPARIGVHGNRYHPVHDVQMAVEGDAARALGDLARKRWVVATGEKVPPSAVIGKRWPTDLVPDFLGTDVAIARTQSKFSGRHEHREAIQLNHDALISARRAIYIEAQYFASPLIADLLAKRLEEKDGPDVVILVTQSARGILERFIMGSNRDRLVARLKKADRYGRLRVMYAVVPNENGEDCEILIHSKVVVVDDRFLRVGSSNLNNRSEGLDTECDLAVEARNKQDRAAIEAVRERLLAEHLGTDAETVRRTLREERRLVKALDRLNVNGRGLRPIEVQARTTRQLPGTGLLDPKRPYWPLQKLTRSAFRLLRKVSRRLS